MPLTHNTKTKKQHSTSQSTQDAFLSASVAASGDSYSAEQPSTEYASVDNPFVEQPSPSSRSTHALPSKETPSTPSCSPDSSNYPRSPHLSGTASTSIFSGRSPLWRGVLKGGVLFLTLVLAGCLLRYADESGLFDASFLNEYVKGKGAYGVLLFLGLAIVFSAIGMPRQLMSVAAGYAFGVVHGTLIMGVGLVGGGLISFYYMRFLARDTLRRRFEAKIAAIERIWLQKPFLLTVCWRLLPLGNNTLTNMLAGASKIRPLPFFCGSFVGYIPQNLIFTLLGSGIGFDDTEKFLYSALLFLVSVSLGIFVYRSLRKQGAEFVVVADHKHE